ncbi:MAG: exodeoxyribonuclease III [Magnetovibrio sp.]|nr:exodeoxyribonuclease III [Magnetovibrio sp.]|tara:strand:+ start:117 stop:905 length:789 start_codon:yes stop_codon:yes gene_type:complete
MKIATWNVNSVKARLPRLIDWLSGFQPDIVLLQETKCIEQTFPTLEINDAGYNLVISGQKSYNGVAILSKEPIKLERSELPGDENDKQARYIEATVNRIRVASIYLPNGNPTLDENGLNSEKFLYKLDWMKRLRVHTENLLRNEEAFVLGGDYNVCPSDEDVYDPIGLSNDAVCRQESRKQFRTIVNLGLVNAFRAFDTKPNQYSYWDYKAGAWPKDNGLLIDHLLLSPQAADLLTAAGIDRKPRGKEKPSDHTPVWCELSI